MFTIRTSVLDCSNGVLRCEMWLSKEEKVCLTKTQVIILLNGTNKEG